MAAPYNPPVKGEDFVIRVPLEDYANRGNFKVSPTIAAGDFKVAVDATALANLTTLPSVSPSGSALVLISLSASEMNGDVITVLCVDQTSPKEWCDLVLCIQTVSATVSANVVAVNSVTIDGAGTTGDPFGPV